MPRHDHEIGARARRVYRAVPFAQALARAAMEAQVADPALRAKLTPSHRLGCKRILLSDDYLPALTRKNVAVNTDGIREIREHAVVDNAGVEHPVDAIILGTGFDTIGLPLTDRIHDADGLAMADRWAGDPTAYLGTAVAGYPNCFLVHGPNIGTGHNSVLQMLESQANYIAAAIGYADATGWQRCSRPARPRRPTPPRSNA
jgi:cation diffusion facilitator CzcD-associated flavoprotein CzcO